MGTVNDPATAGVARPGSLPTKAQRTAAARDRTLTSPTAIEMARSVLADLTIPEAVGPYTAARSEGERLVTHLFETTMAGYRGWRWAVTVSRPPRSRTATVCEVGLLPGEEALLAPAWVPWADRLRPGDVGRSDRLPRRETDERLEPGWEATGEEGDAAALDELDLGRARVLSPAGRSRAAQRWYDGEAGPGADGVRQADATCGTCGFLMRMPGSMRGLFGVCANEWAPDDGRVVSLDHGCGAHSETDLPDQGPEWPINPSRVDDHLMVPLSTNGLDLREGRSIAELAAEQGDDVDAEPGGAPAEDSGDIAGAPGQGTGAELPAQDADAPADAAKTTTDSDAQEAQAEDGVAGTDATAPADEEQMEEPGTKTTKKSAASEQKPAAKRSRRASTSTRRRRTADSPEEASEERSSRLVGLDLGELERATAAASASSAPDAASAAESLEATADRPSSAPVSGESSDTPSERAASARAAVAGLSLALGIDVPQGDAASDDTESAEVDAPAEQSPRTLAELEAILPNRT